jgi:hypothetical protein
MERRPVMGEDLTVPSWRDESAILHRNEREERAGGCGRSDEPCSGRAVSGESASGGPAPAADRTLARHRPGAVAHPRARRALVSCGQAPVGFRQDPLRGLAKYLAGAFSLFALANLLVVRRQLLPPRAGRIP